MRHENKDQTLTAACHRLLFGFFLFCLVWGLAQPDRPSSAAENRSLAQRPAMRRVVTDSGGFARDFESYAADQFPDREQLIGVYTALELAQGKICPQGLLPARLAPDQTHAHKARGPFHAAAALAQAGTLDQPLVWCVLPLFKNEALYDLEPAYFSDETGRNEQTGADRCARAGRGADRHRRGSAACYRDACGPGAVFLQNRFPLECARGLRRRAGDRAAAGRSREDRGDFCPAGGGFSLVGARRRAAIPGGSQRLVLQPVFDAGGHPALRPQKRSGPALFPPPGRHRVRPA